MNKEEIIKAWEKKTGWNHKERISNTGTHYHKSEIDIFEKHYHKALSNHLLSIVEEAVEIVDNNKIKMNQIYEKCRFNEGVFEKGFYMNEFKTPIENVAYHGIIESDNFLFNIRGKKQ